jgi:hypothetical protein
VALVSDSLSRSYALAVGSAGVQKGARELNQRAGCFTGHASCSLAACLLLLSIVVLLVARSAGGWLAGRRCLGGGGGGRRAAAGGGGPPGRSLGRQMHAYARRWPQGAIEQTTSGRKRSVWFAIGLLSGLNRQISKPRTAQPGRTKQPASEKSPPPTRASSITRSHSHGG